METEKKKALLQMVYIDNVSYEQISNSLQKRSAPQSS